MSNALVAKSYTNLEQVTEPYELNGKMYVKVRMNNGSIKQVRAYSETEYKKYNPEVIIVQPAKSRRYVLGFGTEGFIWIFKGDTYSALDWFKASPCRFARPWNWYLSSEIELPNPLPAGIEPIKLMWEEVSNEDKLLSEDEIQKIVESKIYDPGTSEWVGKVGDRLTLTLTCIRAIEVNGMYGTNMLHTLQDENGNIFIWSTAARSLTPGYIYELSGTIKQQTIYRNTKQNILSNCRIKKEIQTENELS